MTDSESANCPLLIGPNSPTTSGRFMSSNACMYVLTVESDWYTSYMCTLNIRLRSVSAFHSAMALVRMVFDQS